MQNDQAKLQLLIERLRMECVSSFADNLLGIYLHGSVAMGCFSWFTGDVDCLVLIRQALQVSEKLRFIQACLAMEPLCPAKGLELSVVTLQSCAVPEQNPCFELHFSPMHASAYRQDLAGQLSRMPKRDPDLIAHFAMVRARGIAIMGKKTEQLFAPIPREWMLDYLQAEMGDTVIPVNENLVYYVLNACRALAFLEKNELLSKQEGGAWGIQYFPEKYTSLLKAVLTAYGGGPTVRTADYPIPEFWLEVKKRWQKGGIVTGYLFGADGYNGPWNNR